MNHQHNIKKFHQWLTKKSLHEPITIETYAKHIKQFHRYLTNFKIGELRAVNHDLLMAFIHNRKGKPYSKAFTTVRIAALNHYFNWACEQRYCTENPVLAYKRYKLGDKNNSPKVEKSQALVILSKSEQMKLLQMPYSKDFSGIRNRCIVILIISSALYAEEVISLRLNDLNLQTSHIDITSEDTKGRRVIFDSNTCKKACSEWLTIRKKLTQYNLQQPLFITRENRSLTKRMLYKIVSQQMQQAKIKKDRLGPEVLRQTAICNMLTKGMTLEEVQHNTGIQTLARLENYRNTAQKLLEEKEKTVPSNATP